MRLCDQKRFERVAIAHDRLDRIRTEGSLDDRDLGGSGIQPGESAPIVDDESGSDHIGTSVHRTGLRLCGTVETGSARGSPRRSRVDRKAGMRANGTKIGRKTKH